MQFLGVYISNLDLLLVGFTVAATIILGFIIFLRDTRDTTRILFFLQSIILSLWSIANYLSYKISDPQLALWLVRSVMFFAVPNSMIFLLLMHTFPERALRMSKWILWALAVATVFTMGIALSPFLFSGVIISSDNLAPQPIVGLGITLFIIFGVFPVPAGIYFLFRRFFNAIGQKKTQLSYLVIGVVTMFSLIITLNFILPAFFRNTTFIPLSAIFTLPFIIFTAYAIIRYGLLDVRIIATEVFTFLLTIAAFFEIILATGIPEIIFRIIIFLALLLLSLMLIRSILREVEQRERLQILSAELSHANEELKKLDIAKSEFISIASHQLRAPLAVIKGYTSLFMEGTISSLEERGREVLLNMASSTEKLVKLIEDLLNLSRIEAGKIKYEFKNADFVSMIKNILEEFRSSADKKEVKFVFQNKIGALAPFSFDPDKIREVAINLIDNAIKYSRPYGTVEIIIDFAESRGRIRLSVRDDGIGIKAEDQPRLFSKFIRTEEAIKYDADGMGIGLYFVKRVIEDHGGSVSMYSGGLGKGSVFIVEIPTKH